VLVILVQLNPQLDFPFLGWQANAQDVVNFYTAVLVMGHFALFYAIAAGMRAVTDDVRGGLWGWHVAPLSNSRVLAGAFLGTLGAAVVPLVGLLAFMPLATLYSGSAYEMLNGQLGMDTFSFYIFALFFAARLLNFALLAACFQLAFRHTVLASFVPLMLALAAALSIGWQGRLVYDHDWISHTSAQAWWLLGFCGLVLILGLLLLSMLTDVWRPTHVVLLLVVILLPAVMGTAGFVSNVLSPGYFSYRYYRGLDTAGEIAYNNGTILPHLILVDVFPNLETAWSGEIHDYVVPETRRPLFPEGQRALIIYNQPQLPSALALLTFGYLLCGVALWLTALVSLDMVRRPQKYLSWRPWRRRPGAFGAGQL
jgi:hypothetical protein